MCFRPAEMDTGGPVVCANCGKRINRVAGEIPSKCPFCKTPTGGDSQDGAQGATPGAPAAPTAPGAPAPASPKPPQAS